MPAVLPPEAEAALRTGNKIEAIKIVRDQRGLGLKEAKELVDRFEAQDPVLAQKAQVRQQHSSRSCVMFLAALIIIGMAVVAYVLMAQ